MTALTTDDGVNMVCGYSVPDRLRRRILEAVGELPEMDPLRQKTIDKIMREYSIGRDPLARWSKRRLRTLLTQLIKTIRRHERQRIIKELSK